MIEVHGYTQGGSIWVEIDGTEMFVPDDAENAERKLIANWEAAGNVIPAMARPNHAGAVKAECRRRILRILNEDQQRNTPAAGLAATMQYGADPANWPVELQRRQGEALAAWVEIERLRDRSDEIEAMIPAPNDLSSDVLW